MYMYKNVIFVEGFFKAKIVKIDLCNLPYIDIKYQSRTCTVLCISFTTVFVTIMKFFFNVYASPGPLIGE